MEKTVVENGFSLEEDYHSIFNFQLTSRGFQASYKVDNLVSDSRDISILVENDLDDLSIKLPQFSKVVDDFGLGVFFEFYRKNFVKTSLFQAKYNKTKTDFSSSVVPINSSNFEDALMVYDSAEEQTIILKTIQIDRSLVRFKSSKDIQYLKKAISANADFLKLIENKFNYIFDAGKSLVRKNLTPAKIENKDLKLFFSLTETPYFYTLKAKLRIEDKNYNLNTSALQISPLYIFLDDLIIPITDAKLSAYILHYQKFSEINYLKKDTPEFFDKIIKPLSKKFEIQSAVLKKSKAKTGEELLEKQVYLTDYVGEFITFKLAVKYKDQLVDVLSTEFLFDENQKKLLQRNQSFEYNFVEEFLSLHANFKTQENIFFLTPEERFENYWMLHSIERMK